MSRCSCLNIAGLNTDHSKSRDTQVFMPHWPHPMAASGRSHHIVHIHTEIVSRPRLMGSHPGAGRGGVRVEWSVVGWGGVGRNWAARPLGAHKPRCHRNLEANPRS